MSSVGQVVRIKHNQEVRKVKSISFNGNLFLEPTTERPCVDCVAPQHVDLIEDSADSVFSMMVRMGVTEPISSILPVSPEEQAKEEQRLKNLDIIVTASSKGKGRRFEFDLYLPGKTIPKKVEGTIYRSPNAVGCTMGQSQQTKEAIANWLLEEKLVVFHGLRFPTLNGNHIRVRRVGGGGYIDLSYNVFLVGDGEYHEVK